MDQSTENRLKRHHDLIFYGIKENTFVRSEPMDELRKVDQQKRDDEI